MNPGDSLGPYVVRDALGAGGMGKVYRARDERLGRDVALKQLSDPLLSSATARRRVIQEARAVAGLSHPNIATIFDVLDTADGPAIVMEYVPGESLAALIARGRLPLWRALDIAAQVTSGLAHAHAGGIVHRDLKPANIQLTPEGTVKILDFGIARSTRFDLEDAAATTVTADLGAGSFAGTPGYMAPEQLAGQPADARSDVYAAGVVMYEMLTGRRPFAGSNAIGSAMAQMEGNAPPISQLVPGIPREIGALVERAMARDPLLRFQTADDLARELRHVHATVAAPAPGPPGLRRRSLAVALVAGALLLGAAGWYGSRGSSATAPPAGNGVFAVLPFENVTQDPSDDPIALGLTDAVADRVSSLESFRALSPDESRRAAAAAGDPAAVARSLGARFVVEGALRRAGPSLDVDVALVSADGERRSAGRYTGDISQTLHLHQRIAEGIVAALTDARAVAAPRPPKAAPTSNQDAFAEYAQARLFLERPDVPQNVEHSIRLFQSAIARDHRFALAYAGLGQAYWAQYQHTKDALSTTKATTAILDALRIDPDRPEVRLSLAVMYQGLGRFDEAEQELRRVIAAQPWNDDPHRALAGVYIERSQWDQAVAELHQAIELRPNYWRNHSELGYAHYRAGRTDEAARAYQRVVDLQPDSALGFHMLGTVHQSAGRLPEALANYTRSNEIRPRWSTWSNIGTLHFWAGDYAKAAAAYEQAIALGSATPDLQANLGDALQKLGQRARARASYRIAVAEVRKQLAVNERDAVSQSLLAMYLAKLGDRAGADAAASLALALNPEAGDVLYSAAIVHALAGRASDACRALGDAVAQGASIEIVRHADELRVLKGCAAYDAAVGRPVVGSTKGAE